MKKINIIITSVIVIIVAIGLIYSCSKNDKVDMAEQAYDQTLPDNSLKNTQQKGIESSRKKAEEDDAPIATYSSGQFQRILSESATLTGVQDFYDDSLNRGDNYTFDTTTFKNDNGTFWLLGFAEDGSNHKTLGFDLLKTEDSDTLWMLNELEPVTSCEANSCCTECTLSNNSCFCTKQVETHECMLQGDCTNVYGETGTYNHVAQNYFQ